MSEKYIYVVTVPADPRKVVTLKAYTEEYVNAERIKIWKNLLGRDVDISSSEISTIDDLNNNRFCKECTINGNTIHYFIDRQEAIDKYCEERRNRVKELLYEIEEIKACIYEQQNWNPYSIEGENDW